VATEYCFVLHYANDFFGIIGGIATVVGFVLAIKEPHKRYFHVFYLVLIAAGVSVSTYEISINARVASVERQADALIAHRDFNYTDRGFVFAALAFLEKNKKEYPDTYARAVEACEHFKCNDPSSNVEMVELSYTLNGLVMSLGTLSGSKNPPID
jgi:hypothetical protein